MPVDWPGQQHSHARCLEQEVLSVATAAFFLEEFVGDSAIKMVSTSSSFRQDTRL